MTETNSMGAPGGWQVRGWRDGDEARLRRLNSLAFGFSTTEDGWAAETALLEHDRTVFVTDPADAARAGDPDATVASAGAYTYELSVPGARTVAAAGVSWVAVSPTHRRRGLLRALMDHQLGDIAARGEPLAILWCTEATIYGRFGYGPATSHSRIAVDKHRAAIAPALLAAAEPLQAELRDPLDCLAEVESVYEAVRASRPGMPRRNATWQRAAFDDSEHARAGGSALRAVLFRDGAGAVRAAARFRTSRWPDDGPGHARHTQVDDLYAVDPGAAAVAWSWIGQLDLVGGYRAGTRPVDDPLPLQLVDLRGAEVDTRDGAWVRLVDVAAAIAARGYAGAADVVVEVADATLPANAGRWRLRLGPAGGSATPTTAAADLSMDVRILAGAYLGSRGKLARAAQAGLIQERTPGAVQELSRALESDVEPWCPVHF